MGEKCSNCSLNNTCARMSEGKISGDIQFPCQVCANRECVPLKEPCCTCNALHYFSVGEGCNCNFEKQI